MSSDIVYISSVRIERIKGPHRRAYLPVEEQPISFGVHSQIAEHYGADLSIHKPHAATLDYLVAAAGGWLTGTFGGALEARGIPAGEGYLSSNVLGEIGKDGNVLVVRRIQVTYQLKIAPEHRETAERVLGFHADFCPVARTIRGCVEISTALELIDLSNHPGGWIQIESNLHCLIWQQSVMAVMPAAVKIYICYYIFALYLDI